MPQKTAFGVDGNVTFLTGHVANFEAWALTVSQDLVDETGYNSGGWEETKGTIKRSRWTATGFPQYDAASTSPGVGAITAAGGQATFQVATGCTLAATCVITTAGISSNLTGQARVSYAGATTGAITTTWDETT